MKEILVVSGKGGTGKTSITAAIASLIKNAVFVDCDVDAADLHLILNPEIQETYDFISGYIAKIRQQDCSKCSVCFERCRFEAILKKEDGSFEINPTACEGCGVCVWSCPEQAIEFEDSLCGQWYVSSTRFGTMVHAKLAIAAENSGKLVSVVRKKAYAIAKENNNDLILIDGPPGIGCPVMASMTGVDVILVVTEPTQSGFHDMERVINLAKHFGIATYVCINKYNINIEITNRIKKKLDALNTQLVGLIPYDKEITQAQVAKKSIVEYSSGLTVEAIIKMWATFNEKIERQG